MTVMIQRKNLLHQHRENALIHRRPQVMIQIPKIEQLRIKVWLLISLTLTKWCMIWRRSPSILMKWFLYIVPWIRQKHQSEISAQSFRQTYIRSKRGRASLLALCCPDYRLPCSISFRILFLVCWRSHYDLLYWKILSFWFEYCWLKLGHVANH